MVAVSDYAGTADTNNITIGRNGSNINGAAADLTISKENSAITLVYVDGTQGWKATDTSSLTDIELQPAYVTATGGTITCSPCGDYKIHTFTGPGTFTVSCCRKFSRFEYSRLFSSSWWWRWSWMVFQLTVQVQVVELVVIENLQEQLQDPYSGLSFRSLCFSFTSFSSTLSNYSWSRWSRLFRKCFIQFRK